MKKIYVFSMAMAAMTMAACSNDDEMAAMQGKSTGLIDYEISVPSPVVSTKSNAEGLVGNDGNKNPWINGDKLRMFATDYDQAVSGTFIAYQGAHQINRELAYSTSLKGWEYSDGVDPVTVSNKKCRMYAYSPSQNVASSPYYNGDASLKPNACPIVFNTPNKVDFLYGTHRNTLDGTGGTGDNDSDMGGSTDPTGTNKDYIDNKNTKARLYMKHAQAYVEVRLLKNAHEADKKYEGEGRVTCVEIMGLERIINTEGNDDWKPATDNTLATKGTCDVTQNGKITVTETGVLKMTDFYTQGEGKNQCNFLLNGSVSNGVPDFGSGKGFALVNPKQANKVRGFHLVVDGQDFYIDAADVKFKGDRKVDTITEIEWKAGYKYIYTFTLTGKGFELVPDPENPEGNKDGDVDGDGIADFITVKPWNDGNNISQDF